MSDQPAPPLPLAGLRVLDLTRLLPGAFGTLLLADQGADVVKVEEPGRGDYLRWLPPRVGSVGAYFVALNRGKRSVALDLKRPAGRQAFLRLATRADAVIEGFRPGVADRLGVGYAAVRAVRPDVVYCSLSGYGQDGPYRDRAGHDLNYLGYVGLLALSGPPDGPPVPPPTQIADLGGGLLAAFALTTALLGRARTGQGAYLDLSLLDGALAWALLPQMTYAATGRAPARGEHELAGGLPCYAVYPTRDGRQVALAALEPQFWQAFCQAVGRPDLVPRRLERSAALRAELAALFRSRTRAEWAALFAATDACCTPVLEPDEVWADPQLRQRGLFGRLDQPGVGPVRLVGPALPNARGRPLRPAPALGEHTEALLAEAGYPAAEIAALRQAGVIGGPERTETA